MDDPMGPADPRQVLIESPTGTIDQSSGGTRGSRRGSSRRGTDPTDFSSFKTPGGVDGFVGKQNAGGGMRRFSQMAGKAQAHPGEVVEGGDYHTMSDSP